MTFAVVAGSDAAGFAGDGGPATSALLKSPTSIAVDSTGNIFIGDGSNFRVRKVSASTGNISTVAGDGRSGPTAISPPAVFGEGGPATSAGLWIVNSVAVDGVGNLYISAQGYLRKVDVGGTITTVNNPAVGSDLAAIAADASNNLFMAFSTNAFVRKMAAGAGAFSLVAGSGPPATPGVSSTGDGGPATAAMINYPRDIAVDGNGNVYIAEYTNHRVRKVNAATGIITTFAGSGTDGYSGDGGPATAAQLSAPIAVAVDPTGNVYIADNLIIRKVDANTGVITTAVGIMPTTPIVNPNTYVPPPGGLYWVKDLACDRNGNLYFADGNRVCKARP